MFHIFHFFNYRGLIMCVIAFTIAISAGRLLELPGEGPVMIIAGPLVMFCDLGYRLTNEAGHWAISDRGGSLLALPLWSFGLLWLVLGIIYTVQAANGGPPAPLGR